ncbi:MAG: hypothetical protein HY954_08545 [Deltaproteobacteria bacterium]|nr:hypothetical protein [Deltaproteobacteria bacterium]
MRHVISIEASHARGMGHLYRGMNLARALKDAGDSVAAVINRDARSEEILRREGLDFETVESYASAPGWEKPIIGKHRPDTWINDRLDTDLMHSRAVIAEGITLFAIDDHGEGAALAKCNFLAMDLRPVKKAQNAFYGPEYMILSPSIKRYRRERAFNGLPKILVTLGGSDTYGVTPRVVNALKGVSPGFKLTVIAGPNFRHMEGLLEAIRDIKDAQILREVPDMIAVMDGADLMICGGGVTLFEAAAIGVPCLAIANEPHEVPTINWFSENGFGVSLGFHKERFEETLSLKLERLLDNETILNGMSRKGKSLVDGDGLERVVGVIRGGQ